MFTFTFFNRQLVFGVFNDRIKSEVVSQFTVVWVSACQLATFSQFSRVVDVQLISHFTW